MKVQGFTIVVLLLWNAADVVAKLPNIIVVMTGDQYDAGRVEAQNPQEKHGFVVS